MTVVSIVCFNNGDKVFLVNPNRIKGITKKFKIIKSYVIALNF